GRRPRRLCPRQYGAAPPTALPDSAPTSGSAGQPPTRTDNGALRGTPGPAGARASLPFVLLLPS
ncbi:hypothetical protein, partial [Streptomyces sp. NPDC088775]|uniref:hypothetical protein n=1 Tax=Streptomyces sp. NPDC088775 TaxID=3365896 RepID=UPI0037F440A1